MAETVIGGNYNDRNLTISDVMGGNYNSRNLTIGIL